MSLKHAPLNALLSLVTRTLRIHLHVFVLDKRSTHFLIRLRLSQLSNLWTECVSASTPAQLFSKSNKQTDGQEAEESDNTDFAIY